MIAECCQDLGFVEYGRGGFHSLTEVARRVEMKGHPCGAWRDLRSNASRENGMRLGAEPGGRYYLCSNDIGTILMRTGKVYTETTVFTPRPNALVLIKFYQVRHRETGRWQPHHCPMASAWRSTISGRIAAGILEKL